MANHSQHHVRQSYTPPGWAENLKQPPGGRILMANLPTPVHTFNAPVLFDELGLKIWIKRDDASAFDISGNKIRKLEFLLADAKRVGATDTVTIGGLQSNHCRATAVSSKQLGFKSNLILRHDDPSCDPGMDGNLSLSRLAGSSIKLVLPSKYTSAGSMNLVNELCSELNRNETTTAYGIPVGGSNWLGTWGYLEFVAELQRQFAINELPDHIVVGCGSGGTTAGIALGVRLANLPIKVTAINVCDSPELFYEDIGKIATDLGVDTAVVGEPRSWVTIIDGQGEGYGISTKDELQYIISTARATGVMLDHCYSGKALFKFAQVAKENPDVYKRGSKVLFVHTGGTLGTLADLASLQQNMPAHPCVTALTSKL